MTSLRRSARIAARNAAKSKEEVASAAHKFHESQIYNTRFLQDPLNTGFVQNDLGSYNIHSHEYRVALELMKKNKLASTKIAKTEVVSSVFAWLIEHPHLLHQIPSFPRITYEKIMELLPKIDNLKATLLLLYSTDSMEVRREKAMHYGAVCKLEAYIHMLHPILKQMSK